MGAVTQVDLKRLRNPDWQTRVLAWWEGYDLSRLPAAAAKSRLIGQKEQVGGPVHSVGTGTSHDPLAVTDPELKRLELMQLDRRGEPVWTMGRTEGCQLIWGRDNVGPGDPQWMVDAVRSFGLGPAKSVLDMSAGLGGSTRALVENFDTWVTGLESSPLLAKLGNERSKMAGMSRKAPITDYDPEHFNQAGSFDLVVADRVVHRVRDKDHLLDGMCACIKPKGGVLLFDFVIEGTPVSWDQWNHWREEEPVEIYPWSRSRMADELVQRNLDLRIAEDVTEQLRAQVIDHVRRLGEALKTVTPEKPVLRALARELQLWWGRLCVLGHGLRFIRYVAIRP